MKNSFQRALTIAALALAVLAAGYRSGQTMVAHHATPAITHMVADGDIGDGTSPTRKG